MIAKLEFRQLLLAFLDKRIYQHKSHGKIFQKCINDKIKQAILNFASETEDNISAVGKIELGIFKNKEYKDIVGLKVKNKNIGFSEIMYAIESMKLPANVKKAIPGMDEKDWAAVTRIMTLIFIALEDDL